MNTNGDSKGDAKGGSNGSAKNGSGTTSVVGRAVDPPPDRVRDLAEACVQFVERSLGVRLDYQPETLSLLDHYLEQGRAAAAQRPEAAILIAHAAGAYFGEVVRRRYPSWWRAEGDDPGAYRIELEPVYLSFSPIQLVADALLRKDESEDEPEGEREEGEEDERPEEMAEERLELEEADRAAVADRLAELPPVPVAEFYAPSMRLEVIDIAVEAIRARRMAEGLDADAALGPDDYEA